MAAAKAMKAVSSNTTPTTAMKATNNKKVAMKAKTNTSKTVVRKAMKHTKITQCDRNFKTVMNVFKKFVGPLLSEYHIIKAYNKRFNVKYPTSLSSSLDIIPAHVFCGLLC